MAQADERGFFSRYKAFERKIYRSLLGGLGVFQLGAVSALLAAMATNNSWFYLLVLAGAGASVPVFKKVGRASRERQEFLNSLYAPLEISADSEISDLGRDFSRGAILSSFTTTLKDGRRGEVSVISNGYKEDPSVIFSEITAGKLVEEIKPLGSSNSRLELTN